MTDMEKKVMVWLCAKILNETELYDTDMEVREQLERMKELCKKRNSLYEKQNDLKGQKQKIEKTLER